jgi:dCMP deaminase
VGISEVVYNQGYMVDTKTAEIFAESGVRLRQFSPPREGLVDMSLSLSELALGAGGNDDNAEKVEDVRNVLDSDTFLRPI